jgi:hypothetical protein
MIYVGVYVAKASAWRADLAQDEGARGRRFAKAVKKGVKISLALM